MSDDEKKVKKKDPDILAVANIMRTEEGRGFIFRQLQSDGVFESIFDIDPIKHAHRSGKRDSGLRLDRVVRESDPDNYIKMIQENIDER